MKNALVSIIIPNYNHAAFLEQRLESVFNQTCQNFEVILLDDASTDESVEILKKYTSHPKVSHFEENKENSGSPFRQWHKGIKLAKGEYIWIAESDDYCKNNFLEELLQIYYNSSDIALSFCQSLRIDSKDKITGNWLTHTSEFNTNPFIENFEMEGNKFIQNYLVHKNVIPNVSAVLFKKDKLQNIMPLIFYPYMEYNADWFYYIQLLCNSKVAFSAKCLNYFRYHDSSVIAGAGKKSGWLKIFKMELEGRKKMLEYLNDCKPNNLNAIKKQAKIGNDKLFYLISKDYINRGKPIQGLTIVLKKPQLLKKIISFIMKKYL